jgi:hypothetical protein
MKRWMLVGLSLLALCLLLPEGWSQQVPPQGGRSNGPFVPRPPAVRFPPKEVKLAVQVDDKAKTARLQVPLNLMLGRPGGFPPGAFPPGGIPQRGSIVPARRGADAGRFAAPTMVGGVALALAFGSGGLWLVRRRGGRYLAMFLALSLFTAGTAAVWADLQQGGRGPIGPPQPATPPLPALKLPAGVELSDKLLIEMVPTGDRVTLIVPKSMVLKKEKAEATKEKSGK